MVQNMLVKDRCADYLALKSNISKNDIKEIDVFVGVTEETEKSLQFESLFSLTTFYICFLKRTLLCST